MSKELEALEANHTWVSTVENLILMAMENRKRLREIGMTARASCDSA